MKRTISLLLSLMMVFGLFTGAVTSANAASFGVSVTPANAVIEGTGSASFTVTTVLDSIADQLKDGGKLDLGELAKSLMDGGLPLDALAALLSSAGFNWDDIIKAMQDNGVDVTKIAEMLTGLMNGGQLDFGELLADLMGDTDLLGMLIGALSNAGFSNELLDSVLDTMQNMDTQGLMEIIGALLGGFVMAKIQKLKFLPILDITMVGFLIGQGIGRWGNFMNQEAFGTATDLPWRMVSENTGLVGVHPCFLYESLWCLLGFVLIHFLSKKFQKYPGQVLYAYLVWYGFERMIVEGLRTDSLMLPFWGLRVSQVISALILIFGIIMLIVNRNKEDEFYDDYRRKKSLGRGKRASKN